MIPYINAKNFGFHFYSITCPEASDYVYVHVQTAQGTDIRHFSMSCLQRQCNVSVAATGIERGDDYNAISPHTPPHE